MLLGRPQTLTIGGCFAGASPAGHNRNVFREAEVCKGDAYIKNIPHEIKLVLRINHKPRLGNGILVKQSNLQSNSATESKKKMHCWLTVV